MDGFLDLIRVLGARGVRFVVIGVAGTNYYAQAARVIFTTQDYDLFLPPDPDNLLSAWGACEAVGLSLCVESEPLDIPRDRWLAEQIVKRRAVVRATDGRGLDVDLTLVMAGFDFETVWRERRVFVVDGVHIPVARLRHIVESRRQRAATKTGFFSRRTPKRCAIFSVAKSLRRARIRSGSRPRVLRIDADPDHECSVTASVCRHAEAAPRGVTARVIRG